jgi:hypothetical protein
VTTAPGHFRAYLLPTASDYIQRKLSAVTEFPELKEALHAWANEAISRLSASDDAYDSWTDFGSWRRDPDGIFRDTDREVEVWNRSLVASQLDLTQWHAVLNTLQTDTRLARQVNTFLGTVHGGRRLEAEAIGRITLPRPAEASQFDEAFERRYSNLEAFLAADEIEYTVIWPLQGLTSNAFPLPLDAALELDAMSDRELEYALNTGAIWTVFPGDKLFVPEPEHRTCARHRYSLPKVTGDRDINESHRVAQDIEERLQKLKSTLEESLALVLPEVVGIAARVTIATRPGGPLSRGATFVPFTVPHIRRLHGVQLSDDHAAELSAAWQLVNAPQHNKAITLALRRLSYRTQRERPEDELLDTMIAAEALYLTGEGDEKYRGELGYRLSQRAALWADPQQLGYSKREVLEIMKAAYNARSTIAHGGTPKLKDMKVRGQKVPLGELLGAARWVITRASRSALAAEVSGVTWPPDWDGLALGEPLANTVKTE